MGCPRVPTALPRGDTTRIVVNEINRCYRHIRRIMAETLHVGETIIYIPHQGLLRILHCSSPRIPIREEANCSPTFQLNWQYLQAQKSNVFGKEIADISEESVTRGRKLDHAKYRP